MKHRYLIGAVLALSTVVSSIAQASGATPAIYKGDAEFDDVQFVETLLEAIERQRGASTPDNASA